MWGTIRCYPSTLIIPLLLLCALTGGGVAIVITLSNSSADDTRGSAQQDADAAGTFISQVLRDVVQPTFSIGLYIQANAIYYRSILRNFPSLSQQLLAQVTML
jgi:Ni/Fe-hydrogenase subunit HybB-like protein